MQDVERQAMAGIAETMRDIAARQVVASEANRDGPVTEGSKKQPRVHPALAEARQLRAVQQRLLGGIEMCSPSAGTANGHSAHAAKAARARWAVKN